MRLAFYEEIQDGYQKWQKPDFWQGPADDSVYNIWAITPSGTICKIRAFFAFDTVIQDGHQIWRENNFYLIKLIVNK